MVADAGVERAQEAGGELRALSVPSASPRYADQLQKRSVEFDPSDRKFSEGVSTAATVADSPGLEFSGLSFSESLAGKNSDADAGVARRLVAQDFSVGFARCVG